MKHAKTAEWMNKGSTPDLIFNKYTIKPLQKAVLNCLENYDVMVNLPTGFGKSLLFQYPASRFQSNKHCAIVIVPLKALVWNTVDEATSKGL